MQQVTEMHGKKEQARGYSGGLRDRDSIGERDSWARIRTWVDGSKLRCPIGWSTPDSYKEAKTLGGYRPTGAPDRILCYQRLTWQFQLFLRSLVNDSCFDVLDEAPD